MLARERLELADHLCASTEREVGVDALLERGEAKLLEASDLRSCERLPLEIGERRAAPERERFPEKARDLDRRRALRLRDEPFEAEQVELVRPNRDQVPGLPGHDHVCGGEQLAEPRDVVLKRVRSSARRLRSPELVDQPVRRHGLVGGGEQQGEQRPRPRSRERDRTIAVGDLERSKDPKLHGCPRRRPYQASAPPQRSVGRWSGLYDEAT
jgi:hypothetical protein